MMRTPLLNNQNSDERFQDILNRYLEMERAGNSRYFDLDELEELIDFYIHISDYEEANKIINYGLSIHHLENILLIKKAKLLVYSNAYDQALSILNSLTCNDAEILCIKGEALTVQGNPKEAVLYFEAFINMHPINERAILSHDIALFLNNHEAHNNAIYIIEKALEHSPKQIDLLQEYAYSLEQNGETERAIEIFNQLLDIDPYKTGAWFLLGSLYYNNNEYNDALDCYEFSLAINPEDTISWLQKAHCLFYLDQFEAAILAYKKYLHEFPKDSNAILFLAECYENREEYETALSFYELAFKLDPENIDASLGSAICCFECKRYNEAKIYIDIANNIFPNNAEILAYKGDIYSQLAFSENNNSLILEGLTAYKASIALDDDQPRICIAIANIFCHFNNYRAAIKYYEMAFEKDSKIHQLPILIAMSYFQIQDYESMKHYLDIGQLENSNIVNDFLELYPDARNFI